MKRMTLLALVIASAFGLWQIAPVPFVSAGRSHAEPAEPVENDENIVHVERNGPHGAPSTFADVIEGVQPAVVNIAVSGPAPTTRSLGPMQPRGPREFEDFLRRFFERQSYNPDGPAPRFQGMGSGFVVDPSGTVVTNHHVVEHASEITVTLNDGTQLDAELIGADPKTDLAVLQVEPDEPLPYARFGDSEGTRVGDWVIAIGNPFGLGGSATTGIVSARGRDIQSGPFDDFLQIDAPINRGNSGGPLFDLSGRVIGINTAIFSPNGGNVGIGFAIPSELAESVIDQLRTSGRVERGWLGVTIQQVDEDIASSLGYDGDTGALVASVVPDSPADGAGLQPGDVIVAVGDEPVAHIKELTRKIASVKPDEAVTIEVWRDGERETLDVSVGESPADVATARSPVSAPKAQLGLSLGELTREARRQLRLDDSVEGALVLSVRPETPAADKGLRRGDVIVMVGQSGVRSVDEAAEAIARASSDGRTSVLLRVVRGGNGYFVAVPFA